MAGRHDSDEQSRRVAELEKELAELYARLAESEDTVHAIRRGEVDAFVVDQPLGQRVYSLRGSEHIYHSFVEQMRDGALTLADDNTIIYSNRRFLDLLGLPRNRVLGTNLMDHVAPEDRYLAEALTQRAHQRESSAELTLASREVTQVPVQILAFPTDVEGVRTVCVLVTDMTEIHRYRYDMEQMVESRTAEIADEMRESQILLQTRTHFLARLAAELDKPIADVRSVVASVEGRASELGEGKTAPLSREGISLAENSLVRLNAIREDIAMLAEVESGTAALEYVQTGIRSVAAEAVAQATVPASEKGVEFVLDVPDEEVTFVTDGRRLRQVILALLLVAVESVEVGPVRLKAQVTPELVARFEVCSPGLVLPFDDVKAMLQGDSDWGTSRRVSDTLPAMSIWAAMRVTDFIRGKLTIERQDLHDCFVLTLPL